MNKNQIIGGAVGVALVAGAIVFTTGDTQALSTKIDKFSDTEVTRTVTIPAIPEKIESKVVSAKQMKAELEAVNSSLQGAKASRDFDVVQCTNASDQHKEIIDTLQAQKDSLQLQIQQAKAKGVDEPVVEEVLPGEEIAIEK